jgi:hypothetical protein
VTTVELRERVSDYLACLRGTPLWACGRAADLLWLQFGRKRSAATLAGGTRYVGDYALNVQCAWRVTTPEGLASAWDLPSDGQIDAGLAAFVGTHCPAVVEESVADDRGGFKLFFIGGCTIEVIPGRDGEEQWRLLRPGTAAQHVVLAGRDVRER